mmetsp:Transcript_9173/g.12355  ORF Transcript_9173/g.12355 Transcript_9173/m.12355 type:complete len:505 (+) Transcript_9173:37-1551(+)
MASFTPAQVAEHNKEGDLWVIVDGKVFDVSSFIQSHPGGRRVLLQFAGKDATTQFQEFHPSSVLKDYSHLCIGSIGSQIEETALSVELSEQFGNDEVPFAEPHWYRVGSVSPYYKPHHAKFRAKMREWVEKAIIPSLDQWEEEEDYPSSIHEESYKAGIYGARWPEEYGGTPPEGGFDGFMNLTFWDELGRAAGGWLSACFLSANSALPPILRWGSESMKRKVGKEVITGKKIICLCVTEPEVGDDLGNLKTTARKEGNHFIVNGEKKFVISGLKAHYLTVACQTGGSGSGRRGISLLLIDKNMSGVTCSKLYTQGLSSSNPASISFRNVKVPASNLIGKENEGFNYLMENFNNERFAEIAVGVRGSRNMIEDSISYARARKTFGKRLIDAQVIRHKIADMIRKVESTQAWLELLMYQWEQGHISSEKLTGSLALLKVHTTQITEFCAREGSQVFGGNSVLRSGVGRRVDRFYRDVRFGSIGGGTDERKMKDLSMSVTFGKPKL